ncbi:hypothetical protein K466DRAFT_597097 [Polyporus arcularius HHB13444]|uniref:DUF6533 domain-containing protein n=1 Tax=Polyporus arcularius HHB13444 TaxID=1314778 RepID=A0A5C3PPP5_9APHY|nr:hypothetical protein K466DRAFT_597097 [Polyporus arcularius HHB13444]
MQLTTRPDPLRTTASWRLCTALLWFDFALTFTTEVRRIWRRRFTGATVVYLFTRYTALIERIFFVLEVFLWNSTDEMCGRIGRVDDILTIMNYFAMASFTILRVYGVWGRDWKPLLLVIPLTLVKPALYTFEVPNYDSIQFGPPWGCAEVYGFSNEMLAKRSIIKDSSELGVRTPLATMLFRDGTAYFLIVLAIQVLTIVSNQVGSLLDVLDVWPYFDQVLTVIFLSHFMLDLRGLYFADHATDTTTRSGRMPSDLRFTTSNIVGNLGATLSTTLTHSDFPTTYPVTSHPEEDTRASEEAGLGLLERYKEEVPRYTSHPFEEGMMLPIGVDDPRVTDVALEEVQSPRSLSAMPTEATFTIMVLLIYIELTELSSF